MKRAFARRFATTFVTGVAALFACVAFVRRGDGVETQQVDQAVDAGFDRVVILGGKTYLTGELSEVSAKEGDSLDVAWSKVSGPGTCKRFSRSPTTSIGRRSTAAITRATSPAISWTRHVLTT